jgi:hypothetical protein
MASQQLSTDLTPKEGDVVSWGLGIAPDFKNRKRLSSGLEPGMTSCNNLVDCGAKMLQLHEDGETVSNLINSDKIDFLWPRRDEETIDNHVSDLTLDMMKANGCRFIKAVSDGTDKVTFTEEFEKAKGQDKDTSKRN